MTSSFNNPSIIKKAESIEKSIISTKEWKKFIKKGDILYKKASSSNPPFNPRFNAVHWAFDVIKLIREIAYGFIMMQAYAGDFKDKNKPGSQPSSEDSRVSYYADNCITRIESSCHKIALTAWAFHCPFNPDKRKEVLDFEEIIDRLENPQRYALSLNNPPVFRNTLQSLKNACFQYVRQYRHLKIHRREPRIEIYGVASHHDWSYLVPLSEPKEIEQFEKDLIKMYPNIHIRTTIKKRCYINGVIYDQKKINRLYNYSDIEKNISACLIKLLECSSLIFNHLCKRSPLSKR